MGDEIGRKKYCSVDERDIIKMKNHGFSYREIANTIQCSLGMVHNSIKYQDKKEKRGRPKKHQNKWIDKFFVKLRSTLLC